MTTEFVCLDETMKIVTTKRISKGDDYSVIEINCPSGYNIIIRGKHNSFDKFKFQIRLTDKDNHELSENSKISIYKKEISEAQTLLAQIIYKNICYNEENKEIFEFENDIILQESDYLSVNVKNPNIDIYNVNLILDIELVRLKH